MSNRPLNPEHPDNHGQNGHPRPPTPSNEPLSAPVAPQAAVSVPQQRQGREVQADAYLTPGELAVYLKLPSKQTVYQWRTRGYGPPGAKIGKHVRFRREDVDKWVDDQKGAA